MHMGVLLFASSLYHLFFLFFVLIFKTPQKDSSLKIKISHLFSTHADVIQGSGDITSIHITILELHGGKKNPSSGSLLWPTHPPPHPPIHTHTHLPPPAPPTKKPNYMSPNCLCGVSNVSRRCISPICLKTAMLTVCSQPKHPLQPPSKKPGATWLPQVLQVLGAT